ncbi:MAG: NAD-binding protein, partial [Candidatus Marinimicrobia bacterium]|nr:NAD-binding protein [Candidatus Neomarinimicrobiota bacterium]
IAYKLLKSNILFILGGITVTAFIGSLLVYLIEPGNFNSLGDAMWWAIVTITTVGYGDMVPGGPLTRFVAIAVMLSGIGFMSLFTANISTAYITRKIREGKGLEKITFKDHIVICGWNENIQNLLDSISSQCESSDNLKVVMVNSVSEDEMDNIIGKHNHLNIRFVKGDFSKIHILEKANTSYARSVLILPNTSVDVVSDLDEKTVLTTLSVKSINPETPVIAFILHIENRNHLKRAKADEIYVSDEFSGYILASHVLMPGISQAYYNLMSNKIHPSMSRQIIPPDFIGKSFKDYFQYIRETQKALLLGFLTEAERSGITDIFSSDTSQLDAFIERKLRMAGQLNDKGQIDIKLNPDDSYVIQEKDIAIIII